MFPTIQTTSEISFNREALPLLQTTGDENGSAFVEAVNKCGGHIGDFLKRDTYIPVRGTSLRQVEQEYVLDCDTDLDGILIEWNDITGLDLNLSYIQVVPPGNIRLKSVYPVLKKHVDLTKYNAVALQVFRDCLASQLCYTDGWETWLGFIPECTLTTRYPANVIRTLTLKMLQELKAILQVKMKQSRGQDVAPNTIDKNNLNDLSKLRIMPDEQTSVMRLFQSSIENIDVVLNGFRKILITFRFGEKLQTSTILPVRDSSAVISVSVHAGLEIEASCCVNDEDNDDIVVDNIDIMWCRQGLQEIVGSRGRLMPTFSFFECANFQSNLDGRCMDIHRDLRNVCAFPDRLNFVQLYCDLPHRYPNTRWHPVSTAIIVPNGVVKKRSNIEQDARTYLSEVDNNFANMTRCRCRLEIVVVLPTVCNVVSASDVLDTDKAGHLLEKYALLAPFRHPAFVKCLRSVGLYLVADLSTLLESCNGTGNSRAVWQAYQDELAIEKLLWGRPMCGMSRLYSINLGPGVAYPSRSRSDAMGFLSLEDSSSCCEDELTTPPLRIYSGSLCVQEQIRKVFGLADLIGGSNVVLGRRLVLVLLKDLHQVGKVYTTFADFHMRLKARGQSDAVVGGTTMKQLVQLLLSAKTAKYPMVIVNVIRILLGKGVDVSTALLHGLADLDLRYFPAFRLYDASKNAGLYWLWNKGFWALTDVADFQNNFTAKGLYLTPLILQELESRKLCHTSTLRNRVLPWIAPCLEKLQDRNMSDDQLIVELTFVTCIAFLMQGMYVDYYHIERLERQLTVNQRTLQVLEIQSKFLLGNFNKFRLWRLHHSLPFKLATNSVSKPLEKLPIDTTPEAAPVIELEPPHCISAETYDDVEELVTVVPSRHLPTNYVRNWTPAELSVLNSINEMYGRFTVKEQYAMYQKECRDIGIPDRSLRAFRDKLGKVKRM